MFRSYLSNTNDSYGRSSSRVPSKGYLDNYRREPQKPKSPEPRYVRPRYTPSRRPSGSPSSPSQSPRRRYFSESESEEEEQPEPLFDMQEIQAKLDAMKAAQAETKADHESLLKESRQKLLADL